MRYRYGSTRTQGIIVHVSAIIDWGRSPRVAGRPTWAEDAVCGPPCRPPIWRNSSTFLWQSNGMVINVAKCNPESTRHGTLKRVFLRDGTIPAVTQVAVGDFHECIETELHSHPTMYEIYFVLEGRAEYRIGSDIYEVGPGDFFYVPPGITHNQRVTAPPHRIFYWGIAERPDRE